MSPKYIVRVTSALAAAVLAGFSPHAYAASPVPVISQLTPSAAATDGPAVTVSVLGAGFIPQSLVSWHTKGNVVQLTTTVVSSHKLKFDVPASLLKSPGMALVTVQSSPVGFTVNISNQKAFSVTVPTSSAAFAPGAGATAVPCSNIAAAVAADFDGDGFEDIVTLCGTNRKLYFSAGTSNGFALYRLISATKVTGSQLTVGDFNGDGRPDLVSTDAPNSSVAQTTNGNGPSDITVLLNTGNGQFDFLPSQDTPNGAARVATGDFNNDGFLDLAAIGKGVFLNLLLGDGTGRFTPGRDILLRGTPTAIAGGDFNGDGLLDLAVALNDGTVAILSSTKGGGLALGAATFPNLDQVLQLQVADMNNDGQMDLISSNRQEISILLGNGNGIFRKSAERSLVGFIIGTTALHKTWELAVADFNGDGALDVAFGADDLFVWLGKGNGGLQPVLQFAGPIAFLIAMYVNHDGAVGFATDAMPFIQPPIAIIQTADKLAFGAVPTGHQQLLNLSVKNLGPKDFRATGAAITPGSNTAAAEFSAQLGACVIPVAPNASCQVFAGFQPTSAGAKSATLVLQYDAGQRGTAMASVTTTGTALP